MNGIFLSKSDVLIFTEYGQKYIKFYSPKAGKNIGSFDINDAFNEFKGMEITRKSKKLYGGDKKNKKNNKGVGNLVGQKNAGFSIFYLTHYQSIIALCLSDKSILFFYFISTERIDLIYELHAPTLEKRIWYLPEHKMWVSSVANQKNILFYS